MVFQEFNLFPHMSVLENVIEGPVTVKGMERAQAIELAEQNLDSVGLLFKKDEYPIASLGWAKTTRCDCACTYHGTQGHALR